VKELRRHAGFNRGQGSGPQMGLGFAARHVFRDMSFFFSLKKYYKGRHVAQFGAFD